MRLSAQTSSRASTFRASGTPRKLIPARIDNPNESMAVTYDAKREYQNGGWPKAECRKPKAECLYTAAVCRSPDKCQISAAYSRIVRSLENVPMRATFSIALRDQLS